MCHLGPPYIGQGVSCAGQEGSPLSARGPPISGKGSLVLASGLLCPKVVVLYRPESLQPPISTTGHPVTEGLLHTLDGMCRVSARASLRQPGPLYICQGLLSGSKRAFCIGQRNSYVRQRASCIGQGPLVSTRGPISGKRPPISVRGHPTWVRWSYTSAR